MELKDAQKIVNGLGKNLNWISVSADARELGTAEGFLNGWDKAIRAAADLCQRYQAQCNDKQHDNRFCFRCSAMEDAADVLCEKILSLLTEKEGSK